MIGDSTRPTGGVVDPTTDRSTSCGGGEPHISCTGDTIREHLQAFAEQGAIPRYAVPERVLFVDALEKTSVGKLDKKALRARYVGPA